MTIDKQKLQKLLWAEVAAWSVSAPDWPETTEALSEFLGKQTLEEVALELLAENEALREGANFRAIQSLRHDCEALRKDAERYRWLCEHFGVTKLPCAVERILGWDVYVADGKAGVDVAIDAAMGKGEQS